MQKQMWTTFDTQVKTTVTSAATGKFQNETKQNEL